MWKSQATKLFVILILLLDLSQINGSERSDDYNEEDSDETPPLSKDVKGQGKNLSIFRKGSKKHKEPFVMERTDELIRKAGYNAESYLVDVPIGQYIILKERKGKKFWEKKKEKYTMTTFKIEIFRIIHPGRGSLRNLPVVLLMHGATGSSSDYVFAGKDDSLGFYLVNSGYDVWLGNLRGNFYGGLNTYKNTSAFWDFSFHEMGLYDLPAEIDFILSATGRSKLFYVGFSMGTTSSYVLLSSRTEYNDKIERMVSLAPVVYLSWTKTSNFLEKFALWNHKFYDTISKMAHSRSYWKGPLWGYRRPKCHKEWLRPICDQGMKLSSSEDVTLFNKELRDKFYTIIPVGTSWKTIMHYSKLATNGKFKPYSYHASKNLAKYGNETVPEYELENIKVPIFLLSAEKDGFSHEELIDTLISRLKGASVKWRTVDNTNFLHLDFFLAKNLRKLVFWPVLNYLRNPYSIVDSPRKPKPKKEKPNLWTSTKYKERERTIFVEN